MFKKNIVRKTSANINNGTEGETIEQKIERIVNNKEPINDGAPIIWTERKDGVHPEYDPRTDRFEIAIDGMDKVSKTHQAKRAEKIKERETKIIQMNEKKDGGAEPTQGKGENPD